MLLDNNRASLFIIQVLLQYDILLLGFTPLYPIHETPSNPETLHNHSTASSRTNRSAMPYHPSRPVTSAEGNNTLASINRMCYKPRKKEKTMRRWSAAAEGRRRCDTISSTQKSGRRRQHVENTKNKVVNDDAGKYMHSHKQVISCAGNKA